MPRFEAIVLTCEHAVPAVPKRYARCFEAHRKVLSTHRAYDIGALTVVRRLARELGVAPILGRVTRLLVELNRSHETHIFSEFARDLPGSELRHLYSEYYQSHWHRVHNEIDNHIARGRRVLHLSVHSFTPVLNGVRRGADVAVLYDPKRTIERTFCAVWLNSLADLYAGVTGERLQLRRNYPYRGTSDGLTAVLRKAFPARRYAGIELEVNQQHLADDGATCATLCDAIARSLTCALTR